MFLNTAFKTNPNFHVEVVEQGISTTDTTNEEKKTFVFCRLRLFKQEGEKKVGVGMQMAPKSILYELDQLLIDVLQKEVELRGGRPIRPGDDYRTGQNKDHLWARANFALLS